MVVGVPLRLSLGENHKRIGLVIHSQYEWFGRKTEAKIVGRDVNERR